jgi:hypothetical protein
LEESAPRPVQESKRRGGLESRPAPVLTMHLLI